MSTMQGSEIDPLWGDVDRAIGQMVLVGWDDTVVTPQLRSLIQEHHVGSILLQARNLRSAQETASLVQELQRIAYQAGHPHPLFIGIDQENGSVNTLSDTAYISQFPGAMGIAATRSLDIAYDIAKATASEIAAVGVNLIFGPVLDVLVDAEDQPLAVRAFGDNPEDVSRYGIAMMNGYKDAGVVTCAKHFPSCGNLQTPSSNFDIPILKKTLEELQVDPHITFQDATATNRVDGILVSGRGYFNAPSELTHVCHSEQIINGILRSKLLFKGLVISECLDMVTSTSGIAFDDGATRAVQSGCDVVFVCCGHRAQLEAISGLKSAVQSGMITKDRINMSLKRIIDIKSSHTSWAQALNPPGVSLLSELNPSHAALSIKAYDASLTVTRDTDNLLPLINNLQQSEQLLLLTPLITPPNTACDTLQTQKSLSQGQAQQNGNLLMDGEDTFRTLGRLLAMSRGGKLLHASYTAHKAAAAYGALIDKASCVIVVTADAHRNKYQVEFTKEVASTCSTPRESGQKKGFVAVAVSSPYDFLNDQSIGTYICTYDFTENAMRSLVRVLLGHE